LVRPGFGRRYAPAVRRAARIHAALGVSSVAGDWWWVCTFLLFARFRYADLFIRDGVRVLLAGAWASIIAIAAQSRLPLSFTFLYERIGTLVNRWFFRAPDYRAAARQFAIRVRDGNWIDGAHLDAKRPFRRLGAPCAACRFRDHARNSAA
jgi:hypothetical protein